MHASAIAAIAYRDLLKLLRDRARMVSTLVFPLIFIFALGGAMQGSFGAVAGFSLLTFTFTGVLAQTLWSSSASGLISLIEDRENDFTQEVFVSPISRYAIVFGKILGETLVALPQGMVILGVALLLGIQLSVPQMLVLVPAALLACLMGGAFGLLVMANLNSQRAANQVFPFIILPQFFLAGVFNPLINMPPLLDLASRLTPMRYAVDLIRGVFYYGTPEYTVVVLESPLHNAVVSLGMLVAFMLVGTTLFVRRERNR